MNPYVGQLLLVPFSFAPEGWAFCDGRLLSISQNETLFQVLGTTFGGDGQNTFGIPDLRGRTPIGLGTSTTGTNYTLGQIMGAESITLTTPQMPTHTHVAGVSGVAANTPKPAGDLLGDGPQVYHAAGSFVAMNAQSIGLLGGSQPHDNLQPYLTLNWIISLFGVFPSQN